MARDRFLKGAQTKRMLEHGSERASATPSVRDIPDAAADFLRTVNYRVRKTGDEKVDEAVGQIAGYALQRSLDALAGRLEKEEAATVTKAAAQLREEMCEPIVKETKLTGVLTLEQLVAQAAAKAEGK